MHFALILNGFFPVIERGHEGANLDAIAFFHVSVDGVDPAEAYAWKMFIQELISHGCVFKIKCVVRIVVSFWMLLKTPPENSHPLAVLLLHIFLSSPF